MSETTAPDLKLVEKIKKMLALANHAGTPEHEAIAAMEMVQRWLADYNLDMTMLGDAGEASKHEKRQRTVHDAAAMYEYQRALMAAVASVNFCKHWTTEVNAHSFGKQRKVKRHMLLGREVNVIVAFQLYDYLTATMDRLLPYTGMDKRGKDALKWLDGCSSRLILRLQQKKEAMVAESQREQQGRDARGRHPGAAPTTNALVLAEVFSSEDDLNTDALEGWEPGTMARNRAKFKAEMAARQAERDAKLKVLLEQGMDLDVAQYVASGWNYSQATEFVQANRDRERAARMQAARPARPETAKQKAARERREANAMYESSRREAERNSRYNDPAYRAGHATADDIGLDDQIERARRAQLARGA